jgi:hypothetical protein
MLYDKIKRHKKRAHKITGRGLYFPNNDNIKTSQQVFDIKSGFLNKKQKYGWDQIDVVMDQMHTTTYSVDESNALRKKWLAMQNLGIDNNRILELILPEEINNYKAHTQSWDGKLKDTTGETKWVDAKLQPESAAQLSLKITPNQAEHLIQDPTKYGFLRAYWQTIKSKNDPSKVNSRYPPAEKAATFIIEYLTSLNKVGFPNENKEYYDSREESEGPLHLNEINNQQFADLTPYAKAKFQIGRGSRLMFPFSKEHSKQLKQLVNKIKAEKKAKKNKKKKLNELQDNENFSDEEDSSIIDDEDFQTEHDFEDN